MNNSDKIMQAIFNWNAKFRRVVIKKEGISVKVTSKRTINAGEGKIGRIS